MAAAWPETVDEILAGDFTIALAYVTPARGVVVSPVTNFAVRDREAGTYRGVNSSVGVWKKLDRIRAEPRVALAFHTRRHGTSDRCGGGPGRDRGPDPGAPSGSRRLRPSRGACPACGPPPVLRAARGRAVRAGLTAHDFSAGNVGLSQQIHTGWLVAESGVTRAVYAPHTRTGWSLPRWPFAFRVASGYIPRRGLREARRRGLA